MARIKRIDHVAIAVRDADRSTAQYVALLGAEHVRTEVLREKAGMVKVAYLRIGENVLSLVQSLEPDGFIQKHIERHGEGLHHLGLEVDDLAGFQKHIERHGEGLHHLGLEVDDLAGFVSDLEGKGFRIPLRDEFSNRSEVVLSPRDASGVVLQVLQWKGGGDATPEERIERILRLQNQP